MVKFKLMMILSSVMLLMVGCNNANNNGLIDIKLAEVTHSIFYAPQYVAIENGYFAEEGLEIDLVGAQGADLTMAALLAGDVQIGLMGPEASIYVYNQGSKNLAVSFAQLTQKDGSFLVGREPDPNFDFSDLAGKEILGGRAGGVPLMTLEYVIKENGVEVGNKENQANVRTDVEFSAMAGAFIAGEGEYVTLFEPTPTAMENEGTGYILASVGEESGLLPYTAYSALDSYISENEDIIQGFTNAVYKGQQFVREQSAQTIAEIIAPHFTELELDDLTTVVQRYQDIEAWSETPYLTEESFNKLMSIMEIGGELEQEADYNAIVNNKFATEAISGDFQ
ncbi:nitrate ABC transporter substrate-binding protein [Candidatus Epulonipiscium fishelsonii]|uniref:Nitrate ABC transporter substrate-binding protein n=1 Tax=Candidatus Epulonipiscium fishelsonii TaxID=77094 RepID=A0ACC8XCU2_9FIRM|nr:nitrate ABC transporter substrate-binding protein [Epulopiscium sp. SCG-B11WGA-EpuloA1]ONI43193.1 nitrate ABC transporter substrate-binding protein [Epulopiscium sp. SCG-B05WGA-EpuloA1]ONI46787.1 nitrate ABC transporter substrate-binding protein [Epulopiscium sp. SCG-C06WGA-EpuloA1]